MPTSRMLAARAARVSSSKCSRGCLRLGSMLATGSSWSPAPLSPMTSVGMRAPRPLPNPLRRATAHLLGQLAVRQGATRGRIEHDDGLAERGGPGGPTIPRYTVTPHHAPEYV